MRYKSGKITVGSAGTIEAAIPDSGDEIGRKPKVTEGANIYRAKNPPLNLSTPNGVPINFTNGYFVTTDKTLISYLKQHIGKSCELC